MKFAELCLRAAGPAGLLGGLLLCSTGLQAQSVPVVVDEVRSQNVEGMQAATGSLFSRQEMQLRAPVGGRLEWLQEVGVAVRAGAELARIDATPLLLQREERLARIQRSRVQLEHLEARLARVLQLEAHDYTSLETLDELRAQRDLARSDLKIAEVQVRQLDDQIGRARIVAPFDGLLTAQSRFAGEELSLGEDIARFVNPRNLELRARLPLSWLGQLRAGDVLEASAAGQSFLGQIRHLIPVGDRQAQTFEARMDLPAQAAAHWALGQLTEVRLPAALLAQSLLVPRDALVLRRDAKFVFRLGADGLSEQLPVKLGVGRGAWIVVDGDLRAGERVIVRGAERLQAGQAVQVIRDLASEVRATPSG